MSKFYDPQERAREKQASREEDARALASGEKTHTQLWHENSFLRASDFIVDFARIPYKR